eukprot:RCo001878
MEETEVFPICGSLTSDLCQHLCREKAIGGERTYPYGLASAAATGLQFIKGSLPSPFPFPRIWYVFLSSSFCHLRCGYGGGGSLIFSPFLSSLVMAKPGKGGAY